MKRLRDLLNPSLTTSTILKPAPVVEKEVVVEETTKKEIEENN
jgi:hypothetical protein